MSQDYNPSLVTKNLVFCGDAAMKSAAGPATLLYDKVNNNNGTMYNGTVVQLDGGDEYLDCGVIDYSSYTGLSVCAWINGPGLSAAQTFVSNWGPSGTSDFAWLLFISQWVYNQPEWLVSTNGTSYSRLAATSTLASGQWHHLVGTWESGSMKLYLNGVLDASGSGPSSIYNPAYKTAVGADFDGGTPRRPFDGMMADVRVYDKVLSLANVKEIYDDSKVIIPTKNDGSGGFIGQSNLKIWLPLMEGTGTIGYDGSGNGNNGIGTNFDAGSGANADWLTGQTGAPQLVEGYNRPITFNVDASSTDYVDTGDVYAADEMTLVAWVNMSVVPSAAASAYPMLFGKRGTDTQRSYFLAFDAANKLYWEIKDAAAVYYVQKSTKTDWNANQWYHIAVNYVASTGIAKMYIDGVEDAGTFSPAQPWSLDPIPDTSATCRIGGGYYYFEGIINEAAIYNKALGATDMAALAATDANGGPLPPDLMTMSYSTSSTSSSNVIGYWRNDNNVTWTDLSGNGKTGTVTGSPPSLLFKQGINGSASTSTGRDNQGFPLLYKNVGAVGFNGSDNEIVIADTPLLSFGNGTTDSPFSMSAWINMEDATYFVILAKGTYNGGDGEYVFTANSVDKLKLQLYDESVASTFENATTTSAITTYENQWTHVCATYNGVGGTSANAGITIYINGVSQALTLVGSGTYVAMENLGAEVLIGNESDASYAKGQIANTQIYDRALTYSEIQQNFAAQANRFQVPRSIVTEGLVLNLDAGNPGSYPGSGTAWYDVSGNGCDFTLDGSGITYSASNGGIFSLTDPSNGGASTTSAITANTSCTLVFWMKTTDGQALFWSGPAVDGGYLGAYKSTNKFYNAAALGGASPTFYTNAVQRSNIYDFIRTGEWMMMEFKSVDMSSLTASHFNQYVGYTFGGSSAVGKIMIYNRNLTSAESAQNFRVDRERFGV